MPQRTMMDLLKGKSPKTWSVGPGTTVFDAIEFMGRKEIGALMVMRGKNEVAGIFTERDYARKVGLRGKTPKDTLVEEAMTPASEMFWVKPETTVEDCMGIVTGKEICHLPVHDGSGFVGLVSVGDVVKSIISEQAALIEHLSNYIVGKYV